MVALCSHIPIDGVSFVLGNDLAGGRVLVTPKVTSIPQIADVPDKLEKMYPNTFPVCAVTRAMSRQKQDELKMSDPFDIGLSVPFMARGDLDLAGFGDAISSHEQLVIKQKADPTLCALFEEVVSEDTVS